MSIQRDLSRSVALRYGLRKHERQLFDESWKLRDRSDEFERRHEAQLQAEIERGFDRFAQIIGGGSSLDRGHCYVERRPVAGKYVVFSDHHLAYAGHRHDFFASSGNRSLYTRALAEYHARGYTLVEAGDVEELIVFEPDLTEVTRRNRMSWEQLHYHRIGYRLGQLGKILDDPGNAELYQRLQQFAAADRLVRIAGNHDYDIQREPLLERFRQRVPSLRRPSDYLLLEAGRVELAILHGHQFDKFANPRYAPRLGEVVAETLAWAYQGTDRVWCWNDGVRDWASGQRLFHDNLVIDDYQRPRVKPRSTGGRRFWEWLFKHNIAWEYFESSTATGAMFTEVLTGDVFLKIRHLDELFIHEQLRARFPDASTRPRLLLGHTHEPRLRPSVPGPLLGDWGTDEHYLNSGAAGRYQNLIWGIELLDGTPTLISWSFAGGPGRIDTPLERRIWDVIEREPGASFIRARPTSEPVV